MSYTKKVLQQVEQFYFLWYFIKTNATTTNMKPRINNISEYCLGNTCSKKLVDNTIRSAPMMAIAKIT